MRTVIRARRLALAAALTLTLGGAAAAVSPAGAASAAGCTQTITGTYNGALTADSGQVLCLNPGAEVTGSVTVTAGGTLQSGAATIDGALTATGAASVIACGTAIGGAALVSGTAGDVVFGTLLQILPLLPTCHGNTIGGQASFTGNTGGVTLAGNQIGGSFACSGNTPAPADDLIPDSAGGTASGQCTALA